MGPASLLALHRDTTRGGGQGQDTNEACHHLQDLGRPGEDVARKPRTVRQKWLDLQEPGVTAVGEAET